MATKTPVAKAAESLGTVIHAYRRIPHMVDDGTGKQTEKPVEVVCCGEKIRFLSNEAGHIVGTVKSAEAVEHLTKNIPEAYIVYQDGDNVPERPNPATVGVKVKPEGAFVLTAGEGDDVTYKVLDDLSDADLRAFAGEAGIEAEALPEVLAGDALRRAIYNLLGGQ